jgi:hypothetical protein
MTPRESRVLFTSLVVKLLTEISLHVWPYGKVEVAVDEWTVHSNRIYIDKETGERRFGIDRIHHPKGFHPKGLALDLLVYINGVYITDGNHPIWKDLDEMAHMLDDRLNFGNEFHDSNHLSFGELK